MSYHVIILNSEYINVKQKVFYVCRTSHSALYLLMDNDTNEEAEISEDGSVNVDPAKIGNASCVTKFVKTLLSLVSIQLFHINRIRMHFLCFRWNTVPRLI